MIALRHKRSDSDGDPASAQNCITLVMAASSEAIAAVRSHAFCKDDLGTRDIVDEQAGSSLLHVLVALPPCDAEIVARSLSGMRGLVDSRACLEDKTIFGETPLLLAVRAAIEVSDINAQVSMRLAVVRSLLGMRADPNTRNVLDETPLMEAACTGDVELCSMLLSFNADVMVVSRSGLVAADFAGDQPRVWELLSGQRPSTAGSHPAPNAAGDGALARAVHRAVRGCCPHNLEAVHALLLASADPNTGNEHGETPLMEALYAGHAELCCLLLEFGTEALVSAEYRIA
mmetsp:Transcript_28877/g.87035  ORF Transcript_28877/g.87035 Transcript_28877/m.87035 type:complete len:288 (+) Transcript_28877:20-883(+)